MDCWGTEHLEVHHLTYDRFGGNERLEDLQTLCRDCHRTWHGLGVSDCSPIAGDDGSEASSALWDGIRRERAKNARTAWAAEHRQGSRRSARYSRIY
jgi:hypothetical protein